MASGSEDGASIATEREEMASRLALPSAERELVSLVVIVALECGEVSLAWRQILFSEIQVDDNYVLLRTFCAFNSARASFWTDHSISLSSSAFSFAATSASSVFRVSSFRSNI